MGDRTKLYIAVFFLAVAIAAWVGSFGFLVSYYYQLESYKVSHIRPRLEEKKAVYLKILNVDYDLDVLKDTKNSPEFLDLDASLTEMLPALDAKIKELENSLENERRDIQTYQEQANDKLMPFEEALQQFQETREDFTAKVSEARNNLVIQRETMQADVDSEKERLETLDREIREYTVKVAEMEEEHRKKRNKLMLEYEKYRKLYTQLVARTLKAEYGSDDVDGKVLLVNLQENYVMLDLGKRDRVRKGMKFRILGLIKGVLPIEKGMVEIREVFTDVSYARILTMPDKENQMQAGDGIANKLYSRDEKLVFVLVGRLKNFNRGEFVSFVEQMGDIVSQQVGTDTDYLIVGTGVEGNAEESKMVELARELGVKIITENFFLKLVTFE